MQRGSVVCSDEAHTSKWVSKSVCWVFPLNWFKIHFSLTVTIIIISGWCLCHVCVFLFFSISSCNALTQYQCILFIAINQVEFSLISSSNDLPHVKAWMWWDICLIAAGARVKILFPQSPDLLNEAVSCWHTSLHIISVKWHTIGHIVVYRPITAWITTKRHVSLTLTGNGAKV